MKKNRSIMENGILKCLRERRSIRKFKSQQITDDELTAVLESGTYAPTGKNRQDPWIMAVQNAEMIKKLTKLNARFIDADVSDPYYGAPTIILVFGSPLDKWKNSVCDGALVLGNMMNAAHAIGLGSCWINREREMFETPEGKQIMTEMGLPDNLIGIGGLSLGYPDCELRQAPPRKKDYYRIVK